MLIFALRRAQVKAFVRQIADFSSQVDSFNAVWQDAVKSIPFYADWKQRYSLPDSVASIAELSKWPVLEKTDLILHSDKLIRKDVKKYFESVTGGATGEPLHFRTMPGESDAVSLNKWIGWARMGIYPDSRCFLLWGHRHFYGQGAKSNLKFAWRQFKDWATNNLRMDATNLSQSALRKDVKVLIRFRPECIVAYSASLLALVRSCNEYKERCQALGVKAVICTAGPLTKSEREEIGEYFNAPVGMEYGSMECGVMAYQTTMTGGRYKVFDSTHLLHKGESDMDGRSQILVTTLTPRYMPLIRYRIGDYMEDVDLREDGSVCGFSEVSGRTGDLVDLGNGVRFHGYSLMVCAEENPKIIAYQLRVNKSIGKIKFVAQTLSALTGSEKSHICKHAADVASIDPALIEVVETDELVKAKSGKIKLVVIEE